MYFNDPAKYKYCRNNRWTNIWRTHSMDQRENQNKEEKKLRTDTIISVGTLLFFIFATIYIYYETLDSLRLIAGRIIYSATLASKIVMILFIIQYSLLFMNFVHASSYMKAESEFKLRLLQKMVQNIGFFLFLNFIAEILILRIR